MYVIAYYAILQLQHQRPFISYLIKMEVNRAGITITPWVMKNFLLYWHPNG